MTPQFELAADSQSTPIELDENPDGRIVLRLRRGSPITAGLIRELNDLLLDPDRRGPPVEVVATQGRPLALLMAILLTIAVAFALCRRNGRRIT